MIRRLICSFVLTALLAAPAARAKTPTYKITRTDVESLSREMQIVIAGLQYLLNGYQVRQFFSLRTKEEREEWVRVFWKMHDPTPTTEKNEMEVEHNIRVNLVRQFFASKKWPGWDKRGEVFIRYGPPEFRGRVYGEVTMNEGVKPPGELWYYRRHNMLVSFENFGLQGQYIYAIDPLGAQENFSPELTEFLLYDASQSLEGKIPQNYLEAMSTPTGADIEDIVQFNDPLREEAYLSSRPRLLLDGIDAIMNPDYIDNLPKDVSAVFSRDQVRKVVNNFEITLEDTPSSYPFNFEDKGLPFYFGIDQFKGGEDANRVEIQIEVPVSIEDNLGTGFEETFHAEVVVWDPQFNEVARRHRDIAFRTGPQVTRFANLLPTQMVVSLPRGYYRVAVSVSGKNSGRSSSYRTTLTCEPYGRPLALSDILFARSITQAEEPSIFTRGPLQIIPHPQRAYGRPAALPIYFEIYSLSVDSRGVTSYTVEYKIAAHTKEKKAFWDRFGDSETPVVSSKFQASGFGPDETQHVTVNTETLREGSYDFLVTVTDDATGEVAYKRGTFSLIK